MTTALNTRGRIDVADGTIAQCSADYAAEAKCPCGASLTDVDDGDECVVCGALNDWDEAMVFVVVLEYEYPEDDANESDCEGCYCDPCECLPNDCNCDPE